MAVLPVASSALVFAEAPSDHPWQAEWIGPILTPTVELQGASWIWADEPGVDPQNKAPGGSRFFHRSIELPQGAVVESAVATFAADNHFKVMVDGRERGRGRDWQRPVLVDLADALRPGSNDFWVEAVNDADAGAINAAGLIGRVRVALAGGQVLEWATDGDWKAASEANVSKVRPVKVIGGLGVGPWSAMAATSAGGGEANLWTCYRKAFELAEKPSSALARIAVDSKYWLWVNGRLVVREGAVKRGPTPSDTYFDVVDLAPHLIVGRNQIAVLAWFFGKDGFSHKNSGKPGFLFELEAGSTKVLSDNSWKTLRHPAFGQASNTPNFRLPESSVHYDARLDPGDWFGAGYDDSGWKQADVYGKPPMAPWNRLWQRSIPQWKDFGLRDYENAAQLPREGGAQPVEGVLPYNAQITPWLKVSGPAGQMIRIRTDNPANEIFAEYITREGEQEFETPAWMSGERVIYEIPAGVRILGMKYRESGFDTEFTGHFSSDDAFLNKLWVKCERTLYINMRDTFFDCPDRERAAWWGDIVIQLAQVFHTFDSKSHSLIRKCMYNLANWQRPSKTFFSPIPAGNWDKELPQQMLASVGYYGFWTYYLNTGDREAIADLYPSVREYLSIWEFDGDGLVVHRSGENGWDWADWGDNVDIRVLDQAWFCLALDGAARMADLLGKPDEAAAYRQRRQSVIDATNAKFWNGSAYRDPGYGGATDDRAQGMAVVAGIAGPEKFPAIKKVLATEFHASPYIEKYILEALFLMNDAPAAIERMKRRYREMVDSPITTLWELFSRAGTINHAWTGGPLTLMAQKVAGVSPTEAGYAAYQVRPQLAGLKRVATGFDSVRGRVELAIARNNGSFHLKLDSPEGTRATVCIPLAEFGLKAVRVRGQTVWLGGKAAGQVEGLEPGPAMEGHATFVVAPGAWEFEAR
jgi:hypothetical protein